MLRLLFLGDIIGEPGRKAVIEMVPKLRQTWGIDFVIVNGENAAAGRGITGQDHDRSVAGGRRGDNDRRSYLGPERGEFVYRNRASLAASDQLSGRHTRAKVQSSWRPPKGKLE